MIHEVAIQTPFIRLDALLKLCAAVDSGGAAKVLIQGGGVTVNGAVCTMRGKKMVDGDTAQISGQPDGYRVRVST